MFAKNRGAYPVLKVITSVITLSTVFQWKDNQSTEGLKEFCCLEIVKDFSYTDTQNDLLLALLVIIC